MAVVLSQGQENGANARQQYYYEDVREGHNIGFLGNTRQAVNSITFTCLLYTSPSPRDKRQSRMPSSA